MIPARPQFGIWRSRSSYQLTFAARRKFRYHSTERQVTSNILLIERISFIGFLPLFDFGIRKSEFRNPKSEVEIFYFFHFFPKSEVRSRNSFFFFFLPEIRSPKSEVRSRKFLFFFSLSEVRNPKSEVRSRNF